MRAVHHQDILRCTRAAIPPRDEPDFSSFPLPEKVVKNSGDSSSQTCVMHGPGHQDPGRLQASLHDARPRYSGTMKCGTERDNFALFENVGQERAGISPLHSLLEKTGQTNGQTPPQQSGAAPPHSPSGEGEWGRAEGEWGVTMRHYTTTPQQCYCSGLGAQPNRGAVWPGSRSRCTGADLPQLKHPNVGGCLPVRPCS